MVVTIALAAMLPLFAGSAAGHAHVHSLRRATLLAQNLLEAMQANPDGALLGAYLDAAAPPGNRCDPAYLQAREDLREWRGAIRDGWGPQRGRGEVRQAGNRLELVVAWRAPAAAAFSSAPEAMRCPPRLHAEGHWQCLVLRR